MFPNSPSFDWQSAGYIPIQVIFTICRGPHGKFHFQHPPIPSSPRVKWVLTHGEKIARPTPRDIYCKCSYRFDRTPVIIVKWNYPELPPATWQLPPLVFGPTDAVFIGKLSGSVLTVCRDETPILISNWLISLDFAHAHFEYICRHLECTQ